VVGHKIRIHPVHFGMGCYTEYCEEPEITRLCLNALKKIGYIGAANINIKRHAVTGKDYILEINPRFSIWTIFDSACGVNLPLAQYCDALGMKIPEFNRHGRPQRWLWFGADVRAMIAYRKSKELTFGQWLKSYLSKPGKIEFHVFSWDDPLPLLAAWFIHLRSWILRSYSFFKRRMIRPLFPTAR
jgi:predicted ATP-grasp superfamily ATP-dependent carboligase